MANLELHKLKSDELKGMDVKALAETAGNIRKQMVDIRMDIFTPEASNSGKVKSLKKSLARVLTEQTARRKTAK